MQQDGVAAASTAQHPEGQRRPEAAHRLAGASFGRREDQVLLPGGRAPLDQRLHLQPRGQHHLSGRCHPNAMHQSDPPEL